MEMSYLKMLVLTVFRRACQSNPRLQYLPYQLCPGRKPSLGWPIVALAGPPAARDPRVSAPSLDLRQSRARRTRSTFLPIPRTIPRRVLQTLARSLHEDPAGTQSRRLWIGRRSCLTVMMRSVGGSGAIVNGTARPAMASTAHLARTVSWILLTSWTSPVSTGLEVSEKGSVFD